MTYALPANPELVAKLPGVSEPMSYLSLEAAEAAGFGSISRLPRTLKVMAEDILFRLPAPQARAQISALITRAQTLPVSFAPGRALLQDFMGIPLMTDMASMRDALAEQGRDPVLLDPAIPVDFVVDHSLNVLFSGNPEAYARNQQAEFERNAERFAFIKWCQQSFSRFRVIPPGRGIMHQVNLEWLSHVVTLNPDTRLARPDTMIGTDSHTTMVNALGVLGWGVGGIEAETAIAWDTSGDGCASDCWHTPDRGQTSRNNRNRLGAACGGKAARRGRGRCFSGISRSGRQPVAFGRPCYDCQYGPRIRCNLCLVPH